MSPVAAAQAGTLFSLSRTHQLPASPPAAPRWDRMLIFVAALPVLLALLAPRAFLAGAAFACVVHTYLFLIVMAPGLVAHYVLGCLAYEKRPLVRHLFMAVLGGAVLTVGLAAINRLGGGSWYFIGPQIDYTRWL